jgi:YVTN family beta-propeller protein
VSKSSVCLPGLALFLFACQATLPQLRPRLADEGDVYLYLQPFPQEAERLRFQIDAVFALHADGREFPLSVAFGDLKRRDLTRQRLLAAGSLPAGEYAGFSFRAKDAFLRSEEGEAALLVPEAPAKVDFTFVVERNRGYLLSLALKYADSVEAGYRLTPSFSIFFPDRPPAGLVGLVANRRSNNITVFNKKSLQAIAVIATGQAPSGMALDQRGQRAFVAVSGEDSIYVIDILAGNVSQEIRLSPGDAPTELALSLDGRTLLSANTGSNTVSIIDAVSRFEQARVNVGIQPRSVAVERTGKRAFAFNTTSNSISVIDVPSRTLLTTLQVDPGPVRGGFNRSGDRLYVIYDVSPYVTVLNPTTLSVVGRFRLRSPMGSIKVDPSTDQIYLGGMRDPLVGLYDPFSFAVVGFVNTGTSIVSMATDSDENNLYLVSAGKNSLLVSNRISKRIVGEIDVGDSPYWVVVMGEN